MAHITDLKMEEGAVRVTAGTATLDGNLTIPKGARAVVLFAHGSGSSRHSPRNLLVARLLNEAKLATLLVDLLTPDEEEIDVHTAHLRFDIELLAERLAVATEWLIQYSKTCRLPIGYFGASTGAAAPVLPQRWWQRRDSRKRSTRSSRAAGVLILPETP